MLTVAAGRDTPAPAPLHIIGGQAAGCIAGAVRLPAEGPGFQTIHLSRSSFWGAPSTIARIETLGEQVRAAGLGDLYIEDISRPRGGPLPGGHLSHQLGLDVDVGLDVTPKRALTAAERETVELPSMVRPDQRGVDPARWTPAVGHAAASGRQPAGGGPHPDQSGDQAAALRRGAGRPLVAAADAAVVRPLGAHAYPLPLSGRSARLRPGRAAAAGRRLRCDAAMVVRSVGRAAEAVAAVSSAAAAGGVQGGDGGAVTRWIALNFNRSDTAKFVGWVEHGETHQYPAVSVMPALIKPNSRHLL